MTENKNFYITTPIYYVNDSPHIGHAYTTIACDVMARFKQLDGYDVKFLTGTDEHGQKVDKAAKAADIDPQRFVDLISYRFRSLVNRCIGYENMNVEDENENTIKDNILNVTNTDFIRTTEERHKKAAQALWKRIEDNGHIYLDNYGGWYSVRDEAYYQESELIDDKAPTGAEVEWVEEESYFFDLSKWQDKLLEFYKENPDFITPKSRYNEVVSFVEGGLKDLSISRTTFDWGVPVPTNDKQPTTNNHIMYVWIDALTNYLTSVGFPDTDSGEYNKFWCDKKGTGNAIHIIGKDILRFHAVYWPAFLMAAKLPLPKKIVAHGWWTIEGEKMSKSIGNVLSPSEMIAEAGGTDQLRYFMMRAMPFGNDGDFSRERLVEVVNADLANNIGNLSQRVLSMIFKNCDGKIPEFFDLQDDDKKLMHQLQSLSISKKMNEFNYSGAIERILHFAGKANEYIDTQAPWKLRKENPERMEAVLYILAESIRCIAILLQPFTPIAANKILDQLAIPEDERMLAHLSDKYALKSGISIDKPEGVFPRIEKK